MPRKTRKNRSNEKMYIMHGCSKSKSKSKSKSCKNNKSKGKNKHSMSLGCPKCGPNCHCGPNCNCNHNCTGNCYLNYQKNNKHRGGSGTGCGSCGCPIAPYKMNQSGGSCGACGLQSGGNFFKSASYIPGPFAGEAYGSSLRQLPGMDGVSNNRNYFSPVSKVIDNDPQLKMSMNDSGYRTLNSMVGGYKYKTNTETETQPSSKSSSKSPSQAESHALLNSMSNSKLNKSLSYKRKYRRPKSNSINGKAMSLKNMKAGGLIPQDLVNLGRDFTFNIKSTYNALNGYKAPVNPLPYKDQLSHSSNNNNILF
jgi:hypothetical protein